MNKVKCVETGNIFRSAREAARSMNIAPQLIYQAIDKGCAAKSYHFIIYYNDQQAAALEKEIIYSYQNTEQLLKLKEEYLQLRKQKEKLENKLECMLVDLFKSWYLKECTIQECSAISGYSEGYLYQRFRNEKVMRGLD